MFDIGPWTARHDHSFLAPLYQLTVDNPVFGERQPENASRIKGTQSQIACSVDLVPFSVMRINVRHPHHVLAIQSTLQGRQRASVLEYCREQALRRWQGGPAAGVVSRRDQ